MCQATKSQLINSARKPRALLVPDTRRLGLWTAPTTRRHNAIMTVVHRFSKRGMFIPCRKDMTADDLVCLSLREVIRLKGCTRQIVSDRDKLFEYQGCKEIAHRFKIEMHQTVAKRPQGNGLAERCNQSILQQLRTHGTFGNNEGNVDLLFAEIQFNNLTSNSLRLSPFQIDEGRTPHVPFDFSKMTSHAHKPSTLSDYIHRAERRSILCAPCSLWNVDATGRLSYQLTDSFESLGLERDGGCWYPNIDNRGNWTLFGVVHTKFSRCSTRARMLNWTSLPPFDGLRVFNPDSIKPYIHRGGQPVWEFPMPAVKTGASSRVVRILARRPVGFKKRRTFL